MVCMMYSFMGTRHNVPVQSVCDDVIFTTEEIDVIKHGIVLAARKVQRSHFHYMLVLLGCNQTT